LGNFTSGNESFLVQSDLLETLIGSTVMSNITQIISGSANSYCQEIKNDTTSGNASIITDTFVAQMSNSTGDYQMNMTSSGTDSLDTSTLLSANSQVNEDFAGPIGNYSVQISPQQDVLPEQENLLSQNSISPNSASSMMLTITSPDGTQTNATMVPDSSIEQSYSSAADVSPSDSGSNGPLVNFVVPVTSVLASASFPQIYSQGSNELFGFFIYSQGSLGSLTFAIGIAGLIIALFTSPEDAGLSLVAAAGIIGDLGTITGESTFFPANVNGQTVNIMYF